MTSILLYSVLESSSRFAVEENPYSLGVIVISDVSRRCAARGKREIVERIILQYSIRIMDKKLTLKLDEAVIDRAKEYAELNHESVSGLVERFLKTLTAAKTEREIGKSSLVAELSGLIVIPEGYDEREDYRLSKASRYNG